MIDMTRREMLSASAGALGAAALASTSAWAAGKTTMPDPPRLCMFSKYLHSRNYAQLGAALHELGFRYVDLTVRPGGHVLPERVKDDLPKAQEELRAAGVEILLATTAILDPKDEYTLPIIETTAKLGIPYLKTGYYEYRSGDILETFADAKAKFRELAAMFAAHRVHGTYHNHSGPRLGCLLWDEWEMIRDLDPKWVGSYFDPCHATIEGGLGGWKVGLNLLLPRITILGVKDFTWKKRKDRGWWPSMCRLADGSVDWATVLKTLAARRFAGLITMHFEYAPTGKPGSDEEKALLAAIRQDKAFLLDALEKAGIETT